MSEDKTEKLGSFTEFFKEVLYISELGGRDWRWRLAKDWINLTTSWIAQCRPEVLDDALAIVWHTDIYHTDNGGKND